MRYQNYKVILITNTGKRYNITELINSLTLEESHGEIAQRALIEVINGKLGSSNIKKRIKLCSRMIIKYRKGTKWIEIMRGIVWSFDDKRDGTSKIITLTLYDNLKYMQETEEDFYFAAGNKTKTICSKVVSKCGIKLSYQYKSNVKHNKRVFRGKHPSDVLLKSLNYAKKKEKDGGRYVVYGSKGKCIVNNVGYNSNVYIFRTKNVISVGNRASLDGIITRVEIRSQEKDKKRTAFRARVDGKISYGIIQRIIHNDFDSDKKKKEAIKTAEKILQESGKPDRTITLNSIDVPEIRKGYKIKVVKVGMLNGYYSVSSVTHNADSGEMTLEVKKI